MKFKKLSLTGILATSLFVGGVAPLTSCSKDVSGPTITFIASDGITLSGNKRITVSEGTTWWSLINDKKLPSVQVPSDYTTLGWCKQVATGSWQLMKNTDIITADTIIKYFAYSNIMHPATTVTLNFSPDETVVPTNLDFALGFTLHEFRAYYDIAEIPSTEGYQFDGFYKVTSTNEEIKIDDTYEIVANDHLKIKWNTEKRKVTLKTDGNGTVDKESVDFYYNSNFFTIIHDVVVTPNDGYKFSTWVDEYGNEIDNNTKMTNNFTATAVFVPAAKYQITFSATEDVTLSSTDPVAVTEGSVWGDLENQGIIPTVVSMPQSFVDLGWVAIYTDGTYQQITPEFVVSRGLKAKYIAYDPAKYNIAVHYYCNPVKEESYFEFRAFVGQTFKSFREFHGIPDVPSFKSHKFLGFIYIDASGNEVPLSDDTLIPPLAETQNELIIKAKFELINFRIPLLHSEHGSINKAEVVVDLGTKWSDAIKDVTVTPDEGYVFYGWANCDTGEFISEDYLVNSSFSAMACFRVATEPMIQVIGNKHSEVDQASQGKFQNIPSYSVTAGWNSDYYKKPALNNNILHYETSKRSCDGRLMASTLAIHIPVLPKTTKTTELKIRGLVEMEMNGHFLGSKVQTTCQIFKLDSATDGPKFYNNQDDADDKRAADPKSIFLKGDKHEKGFGDGWKNWDFNYGLDATTIKYTDTNDDVAVKMFTHYFSVAFFIRCQEDFFNGNQGASCDYYFYID